MKEKDKEKDEFNLLFKIVLGKTARASANDLCLFFCLYPYSVVQRYCTMVHVRTHVLNKVANIHSTFYLYHMVHTVGVKNFNNHLFIIK